MNARQTTYYQQLDDGSSDPIDVVSYCGPEPMDILQARIDDFLVDHKEFEKFYDPNHLPQLVSGVGFIGENHTKNEAFNKLFTSLCGHSVRKSLLLAQNLVDNSVYDPSNIRVSHKEDNQDSYTVGIGDILRAMLVGTFDIFQTSPSNIIDNIFDVEQFPGKGYLLKPRILKVLFCAGNNGITVNRLLDIMSGFGYSSTIIFNALNELKSISKRLIWSDAVRMNFKDEEDLVSHGSSLLHISTAGKGYIDNLYSNIAYVQEVMLDTKVNSDVLGKGWQYDVLEDRFDLLQKFIILLSNVEKEDVSIFVSAKGPDEYISAFGSKDLLTKKILNDVLDRVKRILSTVIDRQRSNERKDELRDFRKKHLQTYEDHIITLQNIEHNFFE